MVTIVLRVWLPDRPGALGQVASRVGAVRGDVIGIEVLDHGAGMVIDELTVALPDLDRVPLLTSEVDAVDGVSVENVRVVDDDRADPNLAALALGAALAECPGDDRIDVLCTGIQRVVEADWVVAMQRGGLVYDVGSPPDIDWLLAFLAGTVHLDEVDDSAPTDLVWAHLIASDLTVAAGRAERPIHERERVRMSLIARLADALVAEWSTSG